MPFKEHLLFEDPKAKDLKIFRYFSLAKFLSLIESKSLYFSQAKELLKNDPWEGSYLKKELEYRIEDFIEQEKSKGRTPTQEDIKAHADMWRRGFEEQKKINFISCWNYGLTESYALWKLYSFEFGVAVQSSFDKLKSCLSNYAQDIFIGEIKYMDYDEDIYNSKFNPNSGFNLFLPFLTKRRVFEFENEYRAILSLHENKADVKGVYVPVNLSTLIEKVYVAPNSPEWFKLLIEDILKKYSFTFEVTYSIIDEPYRDFNI